MGVIKKVARHFLPNPFHQILHNAKRKNYKTFLFAWNRGLGDIALGLYPLIYKTKKEIPDADITFLIRKNLKEGFQLLENIKILEAPDWERGKPYDVEKTLQKLQISSSTYDVIIPWPDPTYWVKDLRGKVTPRLKWDNAWDAYYQNFLLPQDILYIGIQPSAETNYGLWRNWPMHYWKRLCDLLEEHRMIKILLFGYEENISLFHNNVIDLRGKTSLFEMLSIIKNHCRFMILPDSGILSMVYYLDAAFPIDVLSLWADPDHGILKQNVLSPNCQLQHIPFIGEKRNLQTVSPEEIYKSLMSKIEKEELLWKLY